jgi:hypothetical protein
MMPTALKASPATVTQSLAVALTQCTLSAYPASARFSPTARAAVKAGGSACRPAGTRVRWSRSPAWPAGPPGGFPDDHRRRDYGSDGQQPARPLEFRVNPAGKRVIPGYTQGMKTAISVPDEIFEQAAGRAAELGISRSEFFARAARRYLDELATWSLTSQIDQALLAAGDDDSGTAAAAAGRGLLAAPGDVRGTPPALSAGPTSVNRAAASRPSAARFW